MHETTPTELHPEHLVEPFVPLTKGTYPIFNKYPKFIVDYQVQERRRIRKEEVEYLRERWVWLVGVAYVIVWVWLQTGGPRVGAYD